MKKEFVTYEIAKSLKELGFKKPCIAYYLEGIFYLTPQIYGSDFCECMNYLGERDPDSEEEILSI
jgi:hypothetical protein